MTITGSIRDEATASAVQRLVNEIQDAESESRARERSFREAAALVELFDPEGRPDVALANARKLRDGCECKHLWPDPGPDHEKPPSF